MTAAEIIQERFEVEHEVASGGSGCVFRALDRQSGEVVALKIFRHTSPRAIELFLREAAVLAEIRHPGIVHYVAHGHTSDKAAYLAMEWLEGDDLSRYLRRTGDSSPESSTNTLIDDAPTIVKTTVISDTLVDAVSAAAGTQPQVGSFESFAESYDASDDLAEDSYDELSSPSSTDTESGGRMLSVAQVITLGRRLASAVAELHRRGLVHRDIKPANLLVSGDAIEQVKLLDLGSAWRYTGNDWTDQGLLVGTPHYMAPEQARVRGEISPATDVWAIGCVLYQCLTGYKPFSGNEVMEVLARIVVEAPAPLQALRSDVPADLADLIARTLEKKPTDRPQDAGVLAKALDDLGTQADSTPPVVVQVRGSSADTQERQALTSAESRITSMLLAEFPVRSRTPAPEAPGTADEELPSSEFVVRGLTQRESPLSDDEAMAAVIKPTGGHLLRLTNGALLVTIPGTRPPTDQAIRAARAALALQSSFPMLRMALATGRAAGIRPQRQAVRHAARALRKVTSGTIWVDTRTASLLDSRFHISRGEPGMYLQRERASEAARTLLGKPTPWVGRDDELAALMNAFDSCVRDRVAQAILVTAPAGIGKSRLGHEFEHALHQHKHAFTAIHCQGDAVSAGSPFLMLAGSIRRLAGILDGEPVQVRHDKLRSRLAQTVAADNLDRVTRFVGELSGVRLEAKGDESVEAARKDPMLMGQLMGQAWEDWLRAECAHRPVLLVMNDLHWGDVPSVQYVDRALDSLSQEPLLVLALARPEVHSIFPGLWSRRNVTEMQLAALPPEASAKLVREVLDARATDEIVEAVVDRAGGNAFYLEELIRSVAEGGLRLPETVLGMIQARLDALSPEAKRILRAASVFGEVFWHGGVATLLGESGVFDVQEWLDHLVVHEVVNRRPHARLPGETEYAFRHALVREAAYAMLTAKDRRLGHALAGAWLEQAGERDGLILAEHWLRGDNPERAIPHLCHAAEQALEGNDLAAVQRLAEQGIRSGARDEMFGRLRSLQSIACYWQNNFASGQRHGIEATAHLVPGSASWFVAMGSAIASCGRVGDYNQIDKLLGAAKNVDCAPDAMAERIVCLCRGAYQLLFNGRIEQLDQLLERIDSLARAAGRLDALTNAQVMHIRGMYEGHIGHPFVALGYLERTVQSFAQAGDLRNVALERTSIAWTWLELGDAERAATISEQNLAFCRQQNARQAITFAKLCLGSALTNCQDRMGDARRLLNEALAECRQAGNQRMAGWAYGQLATLEHRSSVPRAEEQAAAEAVELLRVSPGLQAWAIAAHARALLELGQTRTALGQARRAVAQVEQVGGILQGKSLPPLILARCLYAEGKTELARDAIVDAAARLARRAARIPDPETRKRFLDAPDNQQTIFLATNWASWTPPPF